MKAPRGPRVAAALLPGDIHEGGLLMASALLAVRGFRVIYLGADTPIEQIAAAADSSGITAVVLSVSAGVPRARAARDLAWLRESLPRRVLLWVGGAGAPSPPAGAERFASLGALVEHLGPGR